MCPYEKLVLSQQGIVERDSPTTHESSRKEFYSIKAWTNLSYYEAALRSSFVSHLQLTLADLS